MHYKQTSAKTSEDISRFHPCPWNRQINEGLVKKILASIEHCGGWCDSYPITVCKDKKREGHFVVLDGQHRSEALRRMAERGLPVRFNYTVVDSEEFSTLLPWLNLGNWSIRDYVYFYAMSENPHYMKAARFSEERHVEMASALALLSGRVSFTGINNAKVAQEGRYQVTDEPFACHVKDTFDNCVSAGFKSSRPAAVLRAFSAFSMLVDPPFPWKEFVRKLMWPQVSEHCKILGCSGNPDDLYMAMENIANYFVGEKKRFAWSYRVRELMAERRKRKIES